MLEFVCSEAESNHGTLLTDRLWFEKKQKEGGERIERKNRRRWRFLRELKWRSNSWLCYDSSKAFRGAKKHHHEGHSKRTRRPEEEKFRERRNGILRWLFQITQKTQKSKWWMIKSNCDLCEDQTKRRSYENEEEKGINSSFSSKKNRAQAKNKQTHLRAFRDG
jgi:hypothetical protein